MTVPWSPERPTQIDASAELEITSRRADGALRGWLPIWVVRVDRDGYVRTSHRRTTGWFGHVVDSRRARVRVPGAEADVVVEDVGIGSDELRVAVDDAYRAKYGRHGDDSVAGMIGDAAASATLRLIPE